MEIDQIYLGDCLDLMAEMEDNSVDLVITDPPYGIKIGGGKPFGKIGGAKPFGKIGGAKLVKPTNYPLFDDSSPPSQDYFDEMFRISKNQIIFGGNYFINYLTPSSCWIVWDKDNSGDFADAELAWTSFTTPVRLYKHRWNGMLQEDMKHKEERVHPTQKPVKLFEWIIKNYAKPGDTICDPFFGSGSCIIACIRLGHPYIGIEKDEGYFNLAKERINKAKEQDKLTTWFNL